MCTYNIVDIHITHAWMDGWMHGRMDGSMDGWTDGHPSDHLPLEPLASDPESPIAMHATLPRGKLRAPYSQFSQTARNVQ